MAENGFKNTVESLFAGMDSFLSTKTVVGEAVTIGDTTLLPLVDVTFGVGAIVGVGFVTVLVLPPWLTGGAGTGVGSGSFSVRYCV